MSQLPIDIEAYKRTSEQLQEAIEGLTEAQLKWKASEKQWSVTEVLAHLADHNLIVSFRIREILAGSEARLPAFSQDEWVAGQRANDADASHFIDIHRQLISYNRLLFSRLFPSDWSKTGVNFRGETVTIATIVQGFIAHVQIHLAQIDRIKREAGELCVR